MPLNIRSEEVNRLAKRLAAFTGLSKTNAVKFALANELRRLDEAIPLKERVRPIQNRIAQRPVTGLPAGKAFYDALSDDDSLRTDSEPTA